VSSARLSPGAHANPAPDLAFVPSSEQIGLTHVPPLGDKPACGPCAKAGAECQVGLERVLGSTGPVELLTHSPLPPV
jgi:hypothetical protein